MKTNELQFTEKKSVQLRNEYITITEVLDKVKKLFLIPELEVMTVKQVAEFYEVDVDVIKKCYQRNKTEIDNDGTIDDDIYIPYHEEENTFSMNEYQYVYYSIPHHLYIVCSKENKIFDYFDMHYINDTKAIDIHWKMIQR